MLQIEEQTIKHYKEYSCNYFHPDKIASFAWERQVNFIEKPQINQLPSAFIDHYQQQPNMYLLCWISNSTSRSLLVKKVSDQCWGKVILNHLPANIAITDQRIFLFGQSQIIVIPLKMKENICIFPTEPGKIMDVKICYTNRKESGVSVVYFNKKQGYFKKYYSKSTSIGYWQKIKPYLIFSLDQFLEYRLFRIILPNLIGVAFVNEGKFLIYDLNNMKSVSMELNLKSLNTSNNLKILGELAQPNSGFQDCIKLFISNDSTIQIFKLEIVRLQVRIENKELYSQPIAIDRLVGGDIIDWEKSKCQFENSITFPAHISDFIINGSQIVIYSFSKEIQSMPTFFKADLSEKSTIHKIISQESLIWQDYFRKKLYNQIEEADLFYGSDSLCLEIQKCKYDKGFNKKPATDHANLHYRWLKQHHFTGFVNINHRVYVARTRSITALQQINKDQYLINHFTDQHKKQAEIQLQMINNQDMKTLSTTIAPRLQSETLSQQQKQFKDILHQIKKIIDIPIPSKEGQIKAHFNTVVLEFNYQYSANLAKDKIIYFAAFLNYFTNAQKGLDLSLKNTLIVDYLRYFSQSLINNQNRNNNLDESFIDTLIGISCQQFTPYYEINIVIIFKKLFQNLFPSLHDQMLGVKQNKYLEMLIEELLNTNIEEKIWLVQRQLKNFVNVVLNIDGLAKEAFSSSPLLFQAYLLTHPPQQQLQQLFLEMLKMSNCKLFLQKLSNISHLIPNQLQILLPLQRDSQIKIKIEKYLFSNEKMMKVNQEQMNRCAKIVNNLLYKDSSLQDRSYNYDHQRQALKMSFQQRGLTQLSTCLVFQKNVQAIYNKLEHKELQNQNYQHLLEIQQQMLFCQSSLFNNIFSQVTNTSIDILEKYRLNLTKVLYQIKKSQTNYKKYYKILYQSNGIELDDQCKTCEASINQQEELMAGGFMNQPIILLDSLCSHIWIQIINWIIETSFIFHRFVQQSNKLNGQTILTFVLKNRLSNYHYVYEDIDKLSYYLTKQGEKSTTQLMKMPDFKADKFASCFTDRNSEQYLLYLVEQKINMNESNRKYINPMNY